MCVCVCLYVFYSFYLIILNVQHFLSVSLLVSFRCREIPRSPECSAREMYAAEY